MFEDHNASVFDALSQSGFLEPEALEGFYRINRQTGQSLAAVVLQSGAIGRGQLLEIIARYLQCEYLADPPDSIPDELSGLLTPEIALRYAVAPLRAEEQTIELAARDPFNSRIVGDLTFSLNKDIRIVVCDPEVVEKWIRKSYGEENSSVDQALADLDPQSFDGSGEIADGKTGQVGVGDTPVIRFVDLVLTQAIRTQASDIHFEPFEDQFRIRCRVDGALRDMPPPPQNLVQPITARLKVMANLNLAEKRVPQDGRIRMTLAGRPVDLRVSTLPTRYGESVVLRVLDRSAVSLDLERLSMPGELILNLRRIARLPNGLFIVTGPTGCGKTTTLYSVLREINRPEIKILTIEDPVEYEIDGIMQVAVNPQIDLSFSRALRSFLRHDPDKILVGEIRDLETARIAVQASLTGHLVLTTLHTNNAPGAVTRLIDMGLEPYLLAATLDSVLAQRLLRRICEECRQLRQPQPELIEQLGLDGGQVEKAKFYSGKGCANCQEEGCRGRIGLFEMFTVSASMRKLIVESVPAHTLARKAREEGMQTLREDGLRAMHEGLTTIEEVLKYT